MHPLEAYLGHFHNVRSAGAATKEPPYYVPLANLFNEIGQTLRPKIRCLINLKNQGAGFPDGGFVSVQVPRPESLQSSLNPRAPGRERAPNCADSSRFLPTRVAHRGGGLNAYIPGTVPALSGFGRVAGFMAEATEIGISSETRTPCQGGTASEGEEATNCLPPRDQEQRYAHDGEHVTLCTEDVSYPCSILLRGALSLWQSEWPAIEGGRNGIPP